MNELFGLSMTYIAIGCVAVTAAILLFVAFIAVRNPVMFKMGLRNIPRRKAQTALIVVGLMLSTLIMSAAFGTGDTLTSSVTSEVYTILGRADEIVVWDTDKEAKPVNKQTIPLSTVETLRREFVNDPDIQAFVPFLSEKLSVQDQRTKLNEASPNIVAFRTDDAKALGGLRDRDGKDVSLAGNEIAVNEKLAGSIDARVGDTLLTFYQGASTEFTVKAIVPNTLLGGTFSSGDRKGAAVDFAVLAKLTGKTDSADGVFVSNRGGVKGGMGHSDAAKVKLELALDGTPYKVDTFKQDGIRTAELVGNAFTTIFIVFGLFSIAAGVLLIFLIFVMLAAERKPEMGMARAIGAKRRQLVESFLAEGMGYDLGAAVVGLVAGMGVTLAMIQIIKSAAGDNLGLNLSVTFTPRSMIVAFCLGVMATFLVIFISSWRASRLNITSAIRDLPETKPLNPEAATWMGYFRAALNGMVALALPVGFAFFLLGSIGILLGLPLVLIGLVSPWFYLLRGSNVALPKELRLDEGPPKWPWILGLALPVIGWFLILPWYFLALGLVVIVRDRKPAALAKWMHAAGIAVPPFGFILVLLQHARTRIAWSAGVAFAFGVAGAALTFTGLDRNSAFFFFLGVSLLFLWVAVTLRYFGRNERVSFTVTSALLLVLWYLPSKVYEPIFGPLNGDIEMFFLSGMVMVTCGVFIIVYNADIVLPLIARLGSRFGRILPALKTGVAYPLTARFRTGMTMIMIGLIMFSLVMMATLNTNFAQVFLNDDTRGGFDTVLRVNDNNRIDNIEAAIAKSGTDTTPIRAAAELRVAYPFEAEVENRDKKTKDGKVPAFSRYTIFGADQRFFEANTLPMKFRASGYETDRAVWDALAKDTKLAVLPASVFAEPNPFGGAGDAILRLDLVKDKFSPFTLGLQDPGTGTTTTVTVIGVMKEAGDTFLALGDPNGTGIGGLVTARQTLLDTYPASRGQRFYLSLQPGTNRDAYAKKVESGLVQASADSLQTLLDDQQAIQNGFLLVFQGFMGLGLVVGIAALAVVASRAVVERRQQIGMLRAIGYQRGMVALSFLFESGFIALSGILLGLTLGLSLAWVLFTQGEIGTESEGATFVVPWLNLAIICAIAFGASMLMTYLPARAASRVPIAEALRYE
ncbi:MAG: FtsX-like permease family protein [Tepidiformaceae bacterium]